MLKSIGTIQLALATLFVVPAVTGQDEAADSLQAQLDATLSSLEYLAGLRDSAQAGNPSAVRSLIDATAAPADATPERADRLRTLREEIARLRMSLDRRLGDAREVAAITSLPPSVVRALGLAGGAPAALEPEAPARAGVEATPAERAGSHSNGPAVSGIRAGTRPEVQDALVVAPGRLALEAAPTSGLDADLRRTIVSELGPLERVTKSSRRKGSEPLPLEDDGYVADPSRLGRLLVRADRAAEAIEVLERASARPETRYWLARAYQRQARNDEALEIYRALSVDANAGEFGRFAARDMEFLEFQRDLEAARRGAGGAR